MGRNGKVFIVVIKKPPKAISAFGGFVFRVVASPLFNKLMKKNVY